jgi:hypothetical protein
MNFLNEHFWDLKEMIEAKGRLTEFVEDLGLTSRQKEVWQDKLADYNLTIEDSANTFIA